MDKIFKDRNNKVHVIDEKFINLLPGGCIQISREEADEIQKSQIPIIDPQVVINQEAQVYLEATDWYVVRFAETGIAIPADIKSKREIARSSILINQI